MEVSLTALLESYDRPASRPTNKQTGMRIHREVTLRIKTYFFINLKIVTDIQIRPDMSHGITS